MVKMVGQRKGFKHTEETKEKISNASKEHWKDKEYIIKIKEKRELNKQRLGYVNSIDTRKKLSDIMKKKWNNGQVSDKQRKNFLSLRGMMKGRKQSNYQKMICSRKLKETRKNQIFPVKDTSIEVKMQNFLKELGINFFTHCYIKEIEHGYQCDIMIPAQPGITKKTIIECFGDYWHDYPLARAIDNQRCKELRNNGWRVLCFWECEIKPMELINLQEKLI